MSAAAADPSRTVLRLRVALRDLKPTPWRRIEVVAADTSLAELHRVIQTAMGWEDQHLHCFQILGRRHDGDTPDLTRIRLDDFHLRAGERFLYTYNHFVPWVHDVRVEAVVSRRPRRYYPHCLAGRHVCPPEWCSGPEALDEIRSDLLGLGLVEDLEFMAAFGSAVVEMSEGTVGDLLDTVGEDKLRRAIDRQDRRDALLAEFDRHRTNTLLAELGSSTAEATA